MTLIRSLFLYSVLLLEAFSFSVTASGFASTADENGAPLIVFCNPAFLYRQHETPLGILVEYNPAENSKAIRAGVAKSMGSTAFGIGYEGVFPDSWHLVTVAGCQQVGPLSLSSNLDFIAEKSFNAAIGVSVGYLFPAGQTVSINLSNVVITDTVFEEREPAVRAIGSMAISEKRMIDIECEAGATFGGKKENPAGGFLGFELKKTFFRNHSLFMHIGAFGAKRTESEDIALAKAGIGTTINIGVSALEIIAGYAYDYYGTRTEAFFGAMVNPTRWVDRVGPKLSVTTSDSVLSLGAPVEKQRLVFVLSCEDGEKGSGVVRRILVISRDYDGHAMIRTYSGGGIAPSSIVWDGRSSNGSITEAGAYFVRLTAVDRKNNTGESVPLRIVIGN